MLWNYTNIHALEFGNWGTISPFGTSVCISVSIFLPNEKKKGRVFSTYFFIPDWAFNWILSHVILERNKLQLEYIFLFIQGSLKILSLCLNFQIELIIFFKVDD